jgi:glutathione synthase/RimK-type ligase-like ATP-grasp enzyme
MSRIAFATCSPRQAMWEDDQLAAGVLAGAGVEVDFIAWDDPDADWDGYQRVVVRSTWDYGARLDEFLAWADRLGGELLRNTPQAIRWNSDKRYLAELEGGGMPVPPTLLVAPRGRVPELTGEVVIKPVTGAGARDTGRFTPQAAPAALSLLEKLGERDEIAMVQPYLDEIEINGETAAVLFGGRFAYALNKRAFLDPDEVAPADETGVAQAMREQDLVRLVEARPEEIDLAEKTIAWIAAKFGRMPLFARVDMVRTGSGQPVLMEVELIEPCLYLGLASGLDTPGAEAFAAAVIAELS